MRALLVVVLEPRPQGLPGFIQCLEVMKPETLLFHSSDQSLNHPVLLRGVGTDELLFQTVLVHRPSVMPRGKYQAVVTTQRNRILSPAQRAVPGNERLLQCCFSCLGVAAGAQPSAKCLSGMAVHNDGQGAPAVNRTTPDTCNVCCPALIRARGHRAAKCSLTLGLALVGRGVVA